MTRERACGRAFECALALAPRWAKGEFLILTGEYFPLPRSRPPSTSYFLLSGGRAQQPGSRIAACPLLATRANENGAPERSSDVTYAQHRKGARARASLEARALEGQGS